MASPDPGRDVPNESERPEPSHPEPACQEAQKWIEAVTGKSFGDKDFRSGLENGILLCELLSAIKPGLVKKINRLPTPIAGLDNLSVFLRGCEELGLRGAQLFDPGDLQDTSVRANLKDSDCNRKLKNVLNTVFWLGKAANGVASYAGPSLNLKEFEGLLAQMKVDSGEEGESPQTRSVRDSGYDCWDSERSESLSPPRHTRDNSLDSLDSFGSRSQHSPSPDVVTRSNCDGRGSDSEADGRRPDVRKDDMSARRTASGESRSSVPFNQFLPNRTNAGSYIPAPRRKPSAEEGEQRSRPQASSDQSKRSGAQHKSLKTVTWAPENNEETAKQEEERVTQEVLEQTRLQKLQKAGIKVLPAVARYSSPSTVEEQGPRAPSPNIILRCQNDFLSSHKSAWDSPSDGESDEAETARVPDVRRDDLASRRAPRGPVASNVHQFVPRPACSSKDRERWEGIRRASQRSLQEKESSETEAADAGREEEEKKKKKEEVVEEEVAEAPSKQRDDLAQRRAQTRPLPQREGPARFVSATMSQADMQKWERLKMSDPRSASMGDMISEEEVGYLPPMSQSRHEHMHEQYNSFVEDEDHWRDDLTRWKNRRRSASQELIKKEEERKRMEKRMKEEGGDKRKSIKTYKEIVEDKERREAELCVAYRSAATPEEAAMVLQRYALRFTISDATLDSLKVPRSAANSKIPADEHKPESNESEPAEQNHAEPAEAERSSAAPHQQMSDSSTSSPTLSPVTISNDVAPESQQKSADVTAEQQQPQQQQQQQQPQQQQQVAGDLKPLSKHTPQMPQPRPNATQPVHHTLPSPQSGACRTLPLLAAKPYCQPRASQSGHKPVKMDGLMRVNGEATDVPVSAPAPAPSAQHTAEDVRDASSSARQGDLPSEVTRAGQEAEQLEEEEAETAKTEEQRPSSGAEEQPEPLQRDQEAETQQEEVQMEEQKAPTQPEEQTLKDVAPSPPPPSRKEEHTPPKPPRHPESVPTFSGSAISSLIGGRNRVVTTTIVTELTQTRVEPLQPEGRTNGQVNGSSEELKAQPASPTAASSSSSTQDFSASVTESLDESSVTIETPMLNLAKRVNHWVWDPNEERKRLESWHQEQERLLQEQYRQEQEKLKQEWERAQLEVEEEERKHNEEERRILEETVTPLTPASLLNQQPGQTAVSPPGTAGGKADALKNSQIIPAESAEQHASKLHFFQDSALDGQPVKKQELLKTASLDRNPQLNQPHIVKRSESHEDVTRKASGQPPSPSRCVSGKRLCSGCSQPLGKGAAMNIDTLGLFFHMQCFKCGGCSRQMGDATAGTDVRIRNGHLSCHECYIATRGRGQPTTL
ncbi:LIM and calponin homology domains-containing protein 1-like isoform X10 [Nelusetta ayraudi]|uniref:LIM and calponin homology domains-containing protein 1-like isoform X10 n=1 Tax=Nelusetta ayraudi TaxID=303726 RepID=UPI003F730648